MQVGINGCINWLVCVRNTVLIMMVMHKASLAPELCLVWSGPRVLACACACVVNRGACDDTFVGRMAKRSYEVSDCASCTSYRSHYN